MLECEPYERCKFKIGIMVNDKIRFYKFAPKT